MYNIGFQSLIFDLPLRFFHYRIIHIFVTFNVMLNSHETRQQIKCVGRYKYCKNYLDCAAISSYLPAMSADRRPISDYTITVVCYTIGGLSLIISVCCLIFARRLQPSCTKGVFAILVLLQVKVKVYPRQVILLSLDSAMWW